MQALTRPPGEMSVTEKLDTIELLWADVSRNPADIPSPEWHKEVLDECRRRAEAGEERFIDWEAAKQEIIRRTS